MRIESEVGKGTTVQLYLPKSSTAVAIAAPAPTEFPIRAAHGNEAILAVEDDDAVLGLAVAGSEELGYTVHTARNAADALIVLRSNAIVDVLFSDVIMPGGMNGAQLAVEARRIRFALKVLLTSGYTAHALTIQHGLPHLEVLGKPYRYENLANKLRLVIVSGS